MISSARVAVFSSLLMMGASACSDNGGSCPEYEERVPRGTFRPSTSSSWVEGARNQTISVDESGAVVTFEKGGVRYRATYSFAYTNSYLTAGLLGVSSAAWGMSDCQLAEATAPTIDAVRVIRDGEVIAHAADASLIRPPGFGPTSESPCTEQSTEALVGEPDGEGVNIGNGILRFTFSRYAVVLPGDAIEVHASPRGSYQLWSRPPSTPEDSRYSGRLLGTGQGVEVFAMPR